LAFDLLIVWPLVTRMKTASIELIHSSILCYCSWCWKKVWKKSKFLVFSLGVSV
jgi:hypothetical protein